METYSHTQKQPDRFSVFNILFTIVVLGLVIVFSLAGYIVASVLAGVIIIGMTWLHSFSYLTISVDQESIEWHMIGFSHDPEILLNNITAVEVIDFTPLLAGSRFGRSLTFYSPKLNAAGYRITGSKFVKITQKDGKTILLGSDEPDLLLQAINARIGNQKTDSQ